MSAAVVAIPIEQTLFIVIIPKSSSHLMHDRIRMKLDGNKCHLNKIQAVHFNVFLYNSRAFSGIGGIEAAQALVLADRRGPTYIVRGPGASTGGVGPGSRGGAGESFTCRGDAMRRPRSRDPPTGKSPCAADSHH